jgi:hypothetical protein
LTTSSVSRFDQPKLVRLQVRPAEALGVDELPRAGDGNRAARDAVPRHDVLDRVVERVEGGVALAGDAVELLHRSGLRGRRGLGRPARGEAGDERKGDQTERRSRRHDDLLR